MCAAADKNNSSAKENFEVETIHVGTDKAIAVKEVGALRTVSA